MSAASPVTRIAVPTKTLAPTGRTNAYVVGDNPAILVDPGNVNERLDEVVGTHDVGHILVTHTHRDHVAAVEHYADVTGATVWARYGREDRFEAATGVEPDSTFKPGTVIPNTTARVLDTPGHARDHISLVVGDGILCGDLAVATGSVVVGAPEGDMRAYLSSLRRLRARRPAELWPGHGPIIDDPRTTCERLIRHRLERERRVLGAVVAGAETVDQILDAAYEKDLTGVREFAAATVECHLEKLAVERKVAWDGRRARTAHA
jgi:glyoxylase-like metal-dependent hydrolase (beta-lactamase superfamily II)